MRKTSKRSGRPADSAARGRSSLGGQLTPPIRSGSANSIADAPETRARILDAAFKTFLERGYEGASTLEIATRAQVSKRELYALFKNKESLFAAGIKNRTSTMRVPLASPDLSTREALADTLNAYGVSLLAGVMHAHVIAVHRLVAAESSRTPELAKILDREGRQANLAALTEVVSEAQALGLVGDGAPVEMAGEFASLLFGDLISRVMMHAAPAPTAAEIKRRAAHATGIFMKLHAV